MRLFSRRARSSHRAIVVGLGLLAVSSLIHPRSGASTADPAAAPAGPALAAAYGRLPLHFEVNEGQTDPRVNFLARGAGYTVFLTPAQAVLVLGGRGAGLSGREGTAVRLTLEGAAGVSAVTGLEEFPGTANYFIGGDPRRWRSNIRTYARVRYRGVYPGVDLIYYGAGRRLEHDFVVAPGTDPGVIKLSIGGPGQLSVDRTGDLVLRGRGHELRLRKPLIYQEVAGARRVIEGGYHLRPGTREVGFRVGPHDPDKPLVIDPVLDYSTYLGGTGSDSASGIAVDAAGNAYVVGVTSSADFSAGNPARGTLTGSQNVFVAKLNPTGSALVYSAYLGGTGSDMGNGIAVDQAGNAYVTGSTNSLDFPTVSPLQGPAANLGPNLNDAFVTVVNPQGSALLFSTYLGGTGNDSGNGVTVDTGGNVYIAGDTSSNDFPTVGATQTHFSGNADAFVVKLNAGTLTIAYSRYLGGSGRDRANAIAADSSGSTYIAGITNSLNFPATANAFQSVFGGNQDAFVVKLDPTGALSYATYLGGGGFDLGAAVAVDATGNAYVTGITQSPGLATAGALQTGLMGSEDAFVAKLSPSGSMLVYFTYLGGSGNSLSGDLDSGSAIAVDAAGNAYVTGGTSSPDFPIANAVQAAFGGGNENAFVAKLDPTGSTLVYSTFLGGLGLDAGAGIAVDALGNAYVTGGASSPNFPVVNALQPQLAGGSDAFVAMLTTAVDTIPPRTTATPSPGPNANGWNNTTVTVTLSAVDNPGGTGVREIHFSLTGAQIGGGVVPGGSASVSISAEGVTKIAYYAVDNAGNQEGVRILMILIDETPPVVTFGTPTPPPNAAGWNNTSTSVPYTVSDNLSGVASPSPRTGSLTLAAEGRAVTGTVTAIDLAGNSKTYTTGPVNIDQTPPTVTCSALPSTLWPPDHTLSSVSVTVTVLDSLSGPAGFTLTGATSSEPDNGLGDGDTPNDIQGFVLGTPSTTGRLRAERAGTGSGRVYTLSYVGTDAAGNSATCSTTVFVPHDQAQ
jgi:beta-propeller repeat-containing protein